jgi:mannose-6-phosphate isomerase-like protein (cupin superfamily)
MARSESARAPEGAQAAPAAGKKYGSFDIPAIAAALPPSAQTMLVDHRMTDETEASSRVFRVYHPTPAHYHATCDEYLYLLSGRVTFFMGDVPPREVGPGQLLFFKSHTVHGMPAILEHPVVFLAVDTPRRDPRDIIFVDESTGTVDGFIRTQSGESANEQS